MQAILVCIFVCAYCTGQGARSTSVLDFIRGRGALSLRGDCVLDRIRWGGVIRLCVCVWGGGGGGGVGRSY